MTAPDADRPLRLLIVDDDFLFADMLPKLLRRRISAPLLDIAAARSPDEAVRALDERDFDVVLCDFDLKASRNGIDVLGHAARADSPPFRVLMSGHTPGEIPEAPEGVVDAFLDKPMTLRDVVPDLTTLLHDRLGLEFESAHG